MHVYEPMYVTEDDTSMAVYCYKVTIANLLQSGPPPNVCF